MKQMERTTPAAAESGLHQVVTIEARFGSDHQRAVAMPMLDEFLAAWKGIVESHHKKNTISISTQIADVSKS